MTDVGDSSGLSRDNDEIRGYLNEALQFRLPELAEQLSKARGLALGIAARKTATQTDLDRLKEIADNITNSIVGIDVVLERADARAPGLSDLHVMFKNAGQSTTNESIGILKKIIAEPGDAQSVDALFDAFTKNINALYAVADECGRALEGFLKSRATQLRHESAKLLLVWVVPFFLILVVFGLAIMRDITQPLKQVVSIADRIAAGDLAVSIPTDPHRRDEMGDLIRSFNRMSDSLSLLVGHVQQSGVSVNTSVTHIAATGKEQQNTADAVARATTELGVTAKEISATSRELLNTMNSVTSVAEGTAQLAGSGREGLARMENMVKQIMDASAVVGANFRDLSDKAANINQVVTTITKIADRTNLLSLNAAIEAEKAGEYGRGPRFEAVNDKMRSQAAGGEQITERLAQLSRAVQQTAQSLQQSNQTIEQLRAAAYGLREGVARFKLPE
ncbi:MAG: methyl-accepting chemotaxis protein [Verrucomicrobia bacterium]|nr:methyl-accepting chemotaxis protein [Verrucomicrobiota bacterium]